MSINKPNPYVPSFLRAAVSGSRPITLTWGDVADTNIESTSSFRYDSSAMPLRSTQQLNVDWSRFENHTFFMSAEAKVNLAFDNIINGYPFDGTRQETERFFDNLTGFDKWVFDSFPRYKGWLTFSGSTGAGDAGTYVEVKNRTGALFPELSPDSAGRSVMNPSGSSMTIEAHVYLPAIANDVQVVFQMMADATHGFSLHLLSTASTSSCSAQFVVVSGSTWLTAPVELQKGRFNHVAVELNGDYGTPFVETFIDADSFAVSSNMADIGDMGIDATSFMIGSGSTVSLPSGDVTPSSTFSGSIDELRFFHSIRTEKQLRSYAKKSVFSTPDLVLYLRFNEPAPPLTTLASDQTNRIVLDSSGNALHSLVTNFTGTLRVDASTDPLDPMPYEHVDTTVVLFPAYPPTVTFNQELLASASLYDQENPNLITRLVPQHYLLEGALQDGFHDPTEGNAGVAYAGSGIPGQGEMGNVQVMVSLLYVWARFFDEMKLFVDAFSTLRTVDYSTYETVPDAFLNDVVKSLGFYLPPMFNDSTLEQYVRGENVDIDAVTTNESTLRSIASTLLRRVLVNVPDVIKSKGTQHSIKSFLRAVGIDPDNNVRIREFGGPTNKQLSFSRESKFQPSAMVQFSSASLVISPFLSASRLEPGYPEPAGTFVQKNVYTPHGISDDPSDGLLTSGSWTWEGIIRYTPQSLANIQSATQSFARLCVTGSVSGSAGGSSGIVANLIAISSSIEPRIKLYLRPGDQPTSPHLELSIATPVPGNIDSNNKPPGVFNNDMWSVSFGCQRGDDGLQSPSSSSYFLRLAYQNAGEIELVETTSSYFLENPSGSNVLRTLCEANASGTFISIGTGQFVESGSGVQFLHLNDISQVPDEARVTCFDGRMSDVRFWSKALDVDEWKEHVRNRASTGVKDPFVNWNYVNSRSGSYGRLRLSSMTTQEDRRAVATASLGILGSVRFIDFSESGMHLTGSGFPIETDCVVGDVFEVSYLSPYFDEATSNEKVRIRSYQSQELIDATPWASQTPIHEIVASEVPSDDVRFVVEFSLVDALNRDIVSMFATLDALDNALGSPELMFSPDYPDLERLRDVYFNRVKDKLNFEAFFEFFRWFDVSIGSFIQQLVPRKTNFKGTNFTVEPHMFERAKQEYLSSEVYLGERNRQNLGSYVIMQQVQGNVSKH